MPGSERRANTLGTSAAARYSGSQARAEPLAQPKRQGRLRVRRSDSTTNVSSRSAGGGASASQRRPMTSSTQRGRQASGTNFQPSRAHLKRPMDKPSSGHTGKKSKINSAGLSRTTSRDPSYEKTVNTPRNMTPLSPRPGTPEAVRQHDFSVQKGDTNACMASPLSRARRNAKVPQLYLSAGTTPPPTQIYKSKKRYQKRILVMAGQVTANENVPPTSPTCPSTPPAAGATGGPFVLPPLPTEEEMRAKVDMDEPVVMLSSSSNLMKHNEEERNGNQEKRHSWENMSERPDKNDAGCEGHSVDAGSNGPTEGGADLAGSADVDDLDILLLRHRPVSEAYHGLGDDATSTDRRMSIAEVKEDIKKALSQPLGHEASLIGELLSRESLREECRSVSSGSPSTSLRRASAPAQETKSPLASCLEKVRRISEGCDPLASSVDYSHLVDVSEPQSSVTPCESRFDSVSAYLPAAANRVSPASNRTADSSPSTAPFEMEMEMEMDEDESANQTLRLQEDSHYGVPPSTSTGPSSCHSSYPPTHSAANFESRTLDEPENCAYHQVHKPSRRRSISEPRGRAGGPGGVMGSAFKEACSNAYFTLNPCIFEDRRVWGISEFRKLCLMLNVDTSRCRDYNDYVSLLQEWNHKPNVSVGHLLADVSSSYHAGDIQSRINNFQNIPILSVKVPGIYRKIIEPLPRDRRLITCLKGRRRAPPSRPPNTRLQFSPYNHNSQFYLSADEKYQKRLCLHEIASMASICNNEEGIDPQVILLDPTRELNGDLDWELAKRNMNDNLIRTNPTAFLDQQLSQKDGTDSSDHSLRPLEISNSQDFQGDQGGWWDDYDAL